MSTVRDLLVTGVRITKGFLGFVYKITDAFIDCEDVFTPDVRSLITVFCPCCKQEFKMSICKYTSSLSQILCSLIINKKLNF